MSRPALRGDEFIRSRLEDAARDRVIKRQAKLVGLLEGIAVGIGITLFIVLVQLHRHGLLYALLS